MGQISLGPGLRVSVRVVVKFRIRVGIFDSPAHANDPRTFSGGVTAQIRVAKPLLVTPPWEQVRRTHTNTITHKRTATHTHNTYHTQHTHKHTQPNSHTQTHTVSTRQGTQCSV